MDDNGNLGHSEDSTMVTRTSADGKTGYVPFELVKDERPAISNPDPDFDKALLVPKDERKINTEESFDSTDTVIQSSPFGKLEIDISNGAGATGAIRLYKTKDHMNTKGTNEDPYIFMSEAFDENTFLPNQVLYKAIVTLSIIGNKPIYFKNVNEPLRLWEVKRDHFDVYDLK